MKKQRDMERETRLELATPTLAKWGAVGLNALTRKGYPIFRAVRKGVCLVGLFAVVVQVAVACDILHDVPISETVLQDRVPVIKGEMVAVCKVPVYDVTAGETDRITAHVQVTNSKRQRPTGTGITAEIVVCDPECEMGNLRLPWGKGRSWPETMNITPKIHHAGYQPTARFVAARHQPVVWFAVLISAYGRQNGPNGGPGYVEIDRCYIEVQRCADQK